MAESLKEIYDRLERHEVKIPFKDRFTKPMEQGIKCRTWRIRKYGKPDDLFLNGHSQYRLLIVERACMGSVPEYFAEEGFNDREDAIQTLKEIFPQNGYQPDRMGWAHWFVKVLAGQKGEK
jgi:hypothetical protein